MSAERGTSRFQQKTAAYRRRVAQCQPLVQAQTHARSRNRSRSQRRRRKQCSEIVHHDDDDVSDYNYSNDNNFSGATHLALQSGLRIPAGVSAQIEASTLQYTGCSTSRSGQLLWTASGFGAPPLFFKLFGSCIASLFVVFGGCTTFTPQPAYQVSYVGPPPAHKPSTCGGHPESAFVFFKY